MNKLNKLVCLLFLSLLMAGCGTGDTEMVETPANMKMQRGRNYREVIEDFQDKGFTNIKIKKIEDLQYGFVVRFEQVETISVGGDTNYNSGVKVPADTEVVISYHGYKTAGGEEVQGVKTPEKTDDKPAEDMEPDEQEDKLSENMNPEKQEDKQSENMDPEKQEDKQSENTDPEKQKNKQSENTDPEKQEDKQPENPETKPADTDREEDSEINPAEDREDQEEDIPAPAISEEAQ